jgi:hypothetical protein
VSYMDAAILTRSSGVMRRYRSFTMASNSGDVSFIALQIRSGIFRPDELG